METVKGNNVARLSRRVTSSPGLTAFDVETVGRKWVWKECRTTNVEENSVEVRCGASDKAHIAAPTRANRAMSEYSLL